jgi:hypothetical protein
MIGFLHRVPRHGAGKKRPGAAVESRHPAASYRQGKDSLSGVGEHEKVVGFLGRGSVADARVVVRAAVSERSSTVAHGMKVRGSLARLRAGRRQPTVPASDTGKRGASCVHATRSTMPQRAGGAS